MTRLFIRYIIILTVTTIIVCAVGGCAGGPKAESGWIPLLHRDNLNGWYTFIPGHGRNEDPNHIFAINNGVLHIYGEAADGSNMPFAYIATQEQYSDYRLRLQFKWGTKRFAPRAAALRDSGLLYHFVGPDIVWPTSVECQIMETDSGSIYAVGTTVTTTIDPNTGTFMESADGGLTRTLGGVGVTRVKMSRDYETEGWNTVEVIIRGDSAVHIINGRVNNRCTNISRPDTEDKSRLIPLAEGKILLQAEGAEIFYRNVEIKPLVP